MSADEMTEYVVGVELVVSGNDPNDAAYRLLRLLRGFGVKELRLTGKVRPRGQNPYHQYPETD